MLTAGQRRQINAAADRGAILLDQFKPDWFKAARLKQLEMSSTEQCMLGQTFGSFGYGLRELALTAIKKTIAGTGLRLEDEDALTIDPIYYGFNTEVADASTGDSYSAAFSQLGERWSAHVTERKEAAQRSASAKKGAATRRLNRTSTRRRTSR